LVYDSFQEGNEQIDHKEWDEEPEVCKWNLACQHCRKKVVDIESGAGADRLFQKVQRIDADSKYQVWNKGLSVSFFIELGCGVAASVIKKGSPRKHKENRNGRIKNSFKENGLFPWGVVGKSVGVAVAVQGYNAYAGENI
jgi:hypothetical protein